MSYGSKLNYVYACTVEPKSTPCRVEVMNVWSYTSAPTICLHGVDRDRKVLWQF